MNAYIDCGSGVAGDMILGALIGLGLPPAELEQTLRQAIPLQGWSLAVRPVERSMWPAWSVRVRKDRPFCSPDHMMKVVSSAKLPGAVRLRSLSIIRALIQAEAAAHGHSHREFDPNGLGRLDTLVDVIGCSWGIWRLGLHKATASALNTGRIAPAVSHMVRKCKVPVFSDSAELELATPTGVAILTHWVKQYRVMPIMRLSQAGYGAGTRRRAERPNVLAIYRGRSIHKLLK